MTKIEIVSMIQQKILEDSTKSKSQFTQKNLMLILDTFFDIVKGTFKIYSSDVLLEKSFSFV